MIITHQQWKKLTKQKIDTAQRLMQAHEWVVAAEYMGYALECALKTASCKTLNLTSYPPLKPNSTQEMTFFRKHDFDSLLIFSGLSDILGANSMTWGIFTPNYLDDWPQSIRYDQAAEKRFTETLVKQLYDMLYDREDSILKTIHRNQRW